MQNQNPEPSKDALQKQLDQFDSFLNVLIHKDWPTVNKYFTECADGFQDEMNNASSWEHFVAARACRLFVLSQLVTLPVRIKAIKEEIEREIAVDDSAPIDPPDYEQE